MERTYRCVGCSKTFKVIHDPTEPPSRQHEVEMNVECPICGTTNAVVWPQHGFYLVRPAD